MSKKGFTHVLNKDIGKLDNIYHYTENVNWNKGIDPKTSVIKELRYPLVGEQKLFCVRTCWEAANGILATTTRSQISGSKRV